MTKQNCLDGISMDEDFDNILNDLDFPAEAHKVGEEWEDWDALVYSQLFRPIPDALMTLPRSCLDDQINAPPLTLINAPSLTPPRTCLDDHIINAPATHKEWQHSNSMLSYQKEFPEAQENALLQTQSPISVLDNRNAISFEFGCKGRRSKRARSTFNPWLLMAPIPCTTSADSDAKSGKENKRKSSSPVANSSLFKRCTHCDVTKTPQWREGPLGPKTLCNACGVRYRSGRLLPEYRPAASPTFIPSLHSNSHRKVVEMRRKTVVESPQCDSQIFAPLPSYLFDTYC